MKKAYLDSSVLIARIEGLSSYRDKISKHLKRLRDDQWIFYISELVLLEILYKPHKQKNKRLLQIYEKAFQETIILPAYPKIITNALLIMELERLKAMDSLHVSVSMYHQCGLFVSTDSHFKNLAALPVYYIDLAAPMP